MNKVLTSLTFGLYSAFFACKAIFFRSNLQARLTVETIFLTEQVSLENYSICKELRRQDNQLSASLCKLPLSNSQGGGGGGLGIISTVKHTEIWTLVRRENPNLKYSNGFLLKFHDWVTQVMF